MQFLVEDLYRLLTEMFLRRKFLKNFIIKALLVKVYTKSTQNVFK